MICANTISCSFFLFFCARDVLQYGFCLRNRLIHSLAFTNELTGVFNGTFLFHKLAVHQVAAMNQKARGIESQKINLLACHSVKITSKLLKMTTIYVISP